MPTKFLRLDRAASDRLDFGAVDAEVRELTVRKAAQLGNGFPVAAPVAVVAKDVHFFLAFLRLSTAEATIGLEIS